MGEFPGLTDFEADLWKAFLAGGRSGHEPYFYYNVRVGPEIPVHEDWPSWMADLVNSIVKLRIDVVEVRADSHWLYEIKNRAGMCALGQIVGYREWYTRQGYNESLPVYAAVVCNWIMPELTDLFLDHDVVVFSRDHAFASWER